jgi:phosphoglycolate phosphatase-like HAD superfamily hydrolase
VPTALCRVVLATSLAVLAAAPARAADPLPSWNDGPAKQAIVAFVEKVTKEGSPDFVAPGERIAVFDNDGTLWAEQPAYFQVFFIADRIRALAPQHPEWQSKEPYRSVLANDLHGVAATGEKGLMELMAVTHAGMTTDAFRDIVLDWVAKARHPKTGRSYTAMVYQPMLELLAYLRANGFKTFVVSGGGQEFMRPWTEKVYGIPPEQVIGSNVELRYQMEGGKPALMKLPEVALIDDKAGKPVGIQRFIGRRPIFAFGNSDGDREMLEWTTAGDGPRFAGIVHHTDAAREWAYDRESKIGTIAKALDQGKASGWTIVDMKSEWKTIFPAAE